ncbi:acetylxylan esterase [Mucilaginibacter sp. 14171R-50]|uniref:acetylxylan esterase n=1 Tax=Mucilaginibacter sp. 14171R-50 TaxID=2703789 RepID=UPI00138DCD7F|nr:acetylxylan esterase [Mucilaginibacter sp. 14171R-50]QHS55553.1 acetylxylan esterase [Mucilaginibacter sp. 14171R-50]
MANPSNKIFFLLLCLLTFAAISPAVAQDDEEGISTVLTSASKNAIFDSNAKYTFEVKNPTDVVQEGTVSYLITQHGKKIGSGTQKAHIGKKAAEKYTFELPALKSGFYKVNFMVNISEYDDTTRRVFGIKPEEIRSKYPKPADFDAFWQKAKAELAQVKPNFKVTPMPKMNTDNRKVYLIEMQSLDNYTIRGWMTVPISSNKNRKFSVLLGLPGYQVNLLPITGLDEDLAIITLNVRGQGNSRGPIDTRRDEFIFYRVEDRDKYVMRGVIMDCIRAVDFVYAQPNLKHDNILVSGGSMGGYLAIATASLDKRVNLCSAQNPILCDVNNLDGEVTWPINDIKKYVRTQPGLTFTKVLDNLNYYDGKNFAANLTCNTIMGIGLLDPYAPPYNEYGTFNIIPGKKKLLVFKDLGHEVSQVYKDLEGRWMRDAFALF